MAAYDYDIEVAKDVLDYIKHDYDGEIPPLESSEGEWDKFMEVLADKCFDFVTGDLSGSYYCNAYAAEVALCGNWDEARMALCNLGYEGVDVLEMGAEWLDVIVRINVLPIAVAIAVQWYREDMENNID